MVNYQSQTDRKYKYHFYSSCVYGPGPDVNVDFKFDQFPLQNEIFLTNIDHLARINNIGSHYGVKSPLTSR